jgi:hypothetical protein
MSLLSIGAVGIYRDLAPQANRISAKAAVAADPLVAPHPGPATAAAGAARAALADQDAGSVASFGQLLVAQIPSEALLAYTTLLALFSAATSGYQPGRWVLYGLSLPACAAAVIGSYLARRSYTFADAEPATSTFRGLLRHLPWLPTISSVLAMGVYGLTVPGNALQRAVSPTGFAITSGCLAVGGGLMMSIFAPFLAKGNGATTKPGPTTASPQRQGQLGGSSAAGSPDALAHDRR